MTEEPLADLDVRGLEPTDDAPRVALGRAGVRVVAIAVGLAAMAGCATAPCEDDVAWRAAVGVRDVPAEPVDVEACPAIIDGRIVVEVAGERRDVLVRLPESPEGAPVVFAFHGNDRAAESFLDDLDVAGLVAATGAIVIAPIGVQRGYFFDWAVPPNDPTPDATLFDVLLGCVDAQHAIDRTRVSVVGFSSGGLWAAWLVGHRAQHLASAVVLSGGTDAPVPGGCLNPYQVPAWPVPVLVAHGGDDRAFLDFRQTSEHFAAKLDRDGVPHALCDHGLGHVVPESLGGWAWPWLDEAAFGVDAGTAVPGFCERG